MVVFGTVWPLFSRQAFRQLIAFPVEARLDLRHVDRRQVFRQDVAVGICMDLRLVEVVGLGDEFVGDIAGGIDGRLADALEELEETVPGGMLCSPQPARFAMSPLKVRWICIRLSVPARAP